MYRIILILDKFFLKFEEGVGGQIWELAKENTSFHFKTNRKSIGSSKKGLRIPKAALRLGDRTPKILNIFNTLTYVLLWGFFSLWVSLTILFGSRTIAPWMIASFPPPPQNIASEENCLTHHKIPPKNNSLHSSKFPSKSTTSELKKTMHFLQVL